MINAMLRAELEEAVLDENDCPVLTIPQARAYAEFISAHAAANATLDKLREVVPEGALCYCYECDAFVVGGEIRRSYNKRCPHCKAEDLTAFAHELQAILYPPETPNEN